MEKEWPFLCLLAHLVLGGMLLKAIIIKGLGIMSYREKREICVNSRIVYSDVNQCISECYSNVNKCQMDGDIL